MSKVIFKCIPQDETDSIIRDLRGEISHLREKITKNPDARKEEIVKMEVRQQISVPA